MGGDSNEQSTLQQYLKENDIHSLVVNIIERLLIAQPNEPKRFIVDYLLVST